jgi:hypothetical protein
VRKWSEVWHEQPDCPNLRGDDQSIVVIIDVERFLPLGIANEMQVTRFFVEEHVGEHAVQVPGNVLWQ